MKNKLFITVILILLYANYAHAQGCVAVRGTGGMCMLGHVEDSSKWQFNFNNRYFKSYKHFVGTDEQKQREVDGTNVINHTFISELSLTYSLNKRWSFSVLAPIVNNERSSLYEHANTKRATTRSFGLGDVRLIAYYMLLKPSPRQKFNIQTGLGIKLATGDYKYMDYFYNGTAGAKQLGPVDQSIQLGDGGTGITTEINTYYNVNSQLSFYGSFFYLMNPREQNGVSTARGNAPTATAIANGSDVMSVPDQYMYRAGANYMFKALSVSLGLRKECIPVNDLIGGSNGFRRPGFIVSVEPGLVYKSKNTTFYTLFPIAVQRDRTQSVPDKIRSQSTGVFTQGDAAFADYSINVGVSFKF